MKYINITPDYYAEKNFCQDIYEELDKYFDDDITLCVRGWDQTEDYGDIKRITIVTSAEGHKYFPEEQKSDKCLALFMHYAPKIDIRKYAKPAIWNAVARAQQYIPNTFVKIEKVYPLPLGCTKFFEDGEFIPYNNRKHDVTFVGQLDPYKRAEFYRAVQKLSEQLVDRKMCLGFYEGWNKGFSGAEYSNIMRDTKVALVPWGSASLDTFRFYEAARSGCVILADRQNEYEFFEGSPHTEVSDWTNIITDVNAILNDELSAQRALNTREFWKSNLSPIASAKYILSKVKND